MASKRSAGIVMFRRSEAGLQVLLVHPGGPYWAKRDLGAWSIPKGEIDPGEDELVAAMRELREETGFEAAGPFIPLTPLRQKSGKVIHAWAVEGDGDVSNVQSVTFSMEWPPRSGSMQEFPEVDRAEWFSMAEAAKRILPGQLGFLLELRLIASAHPRSQQ